VRVSSKRRGLVSTLPNPIGASPVLCVCCFLPSNTRHSHSHTHECHLTSHSDIKKMLLRANYLGPVASSVHAAVQLIVAARAQRAAKKLTNVASFRPAAAGSTGDVRPPSPTTTASKPQPVVTASVQDVPDDTDGGVEEAVVEIGELRAMRRRHSNIQEVVGTVFDSSDEDEAKGTPVTG